MGARPQSGKLGMGILVLFAADRLRSQSKIPAQQVAVVLCTLLLRGRDLAKRVEAQGGSRGTWR